VLCRRGTLCDFCSLCRRSGGAGGRRVEGAGGRKRGWERCVIVVFRNSIVGHVSRVVGIAAVVGGGVNGRRRGRWVHWVKGVHRGVHLMGRV
jgi:hypothetical protein